MVKPATLVDLTWTEDLVFDAATPDGRHLVTDGRSRQGLSPVELLAAATAACMAMDVVHILGKSRQPPVGLRVRFTGKRADTEPHRFVGIELAFEVDGDVSPSAVDRAIQLSRDKYCSVWNSLRQDIALEIVTRIHATAAGA